MRPTLESNLRRVRERIASAVASAEAPGRAELLAITKYQAPDVAAELCRLGVADLGENRVEGLERKRRWFESQAPELAPRWHFVGHIQRNKARRVALLADEIHSVDSLRLLEALDRVCVEEGRAPAVYLQFELAGEDQKHGLDPADLPRAVDALAAAEALRPAGLMCMAPRIDRPEDARRAASTFAALAALARRADDIEWIAGRPLLSMGMSDDLELAVREGSDWLRIGSALFAGLADAASEARSN